MKFWQKAFLAILVLFVVSMNIGLYLVSTYSFSLNVHQETDRDMGEYQFILNGIYETISSLSYRQQGTPTTSSIDSLMSSYTDYYTTQGVYLDLQQSNKMLFSNVPSAAQSILNVDKSPKSGYAMKILPTGGTHYLYIVGQVSGLNGNYTLAYVKNLANLYESHARLTRYLIVISTVIETLLALTLLLVLQKLTYPIRLMQGATRKIAGGVYDERVRVAGRDEFHDLAENFNMMALSIQEKIDELDQNVQEKQRLIDNLAHELRTPLTAIRGHAEYFQNAHANEQNRIKSAGYIISATDRMKDLVHKLLDLALVRNSKLDLQEIDPLELLRRVETLTTAQLKEKNITLEVRCALEKTLVGDSILLESMLVNLIDNAVKASANHSVITLSAYFDSAPILEVRDSGCGMEEEQLAFVCEPFYRVDKARSRSSGGVGLGLSLCREIARLHQAQLRIDSQPGKGTTVRIVFTTSLQLPDNFITSADI